MEHPCKNQYIIIGEKHYRKDWRGDCWIYHLMENGYEVETYTEEEFNNL
jgi:hypothetical protein